MNEHNKKTIFSFAFLVKVEIFLKYPKIFQKNVILSLTFYAICVTMTVVENSSVKNHRQRTWE